MIRCVPIRGLLNSPRKSACNRAPRKPSQLLLQSQSSFGVFFCSAPHLKPQPELKLKPSRKLSGPDLSEELAVFVHKRDRPLAVEKIIDVHSNRQDGSFFEGDFFFNGEVHIHMCGCGPDAAAFGEGKIEAHPFQQPLFLPIIAGKVFQAEGEHKSIGSDVSAQYFYQVIHAVGKNPIPAFIAELSSTAPLEKPFDEILIWCSFRHVGMVAKKSPFVKVATGICPTALVIIISRIRSFGLRPCIGDIQPKVIGDFPVQLELQRPVISPL